MQLNLENILEIISDGECHYPKSNLTIDNFMPIHSAFPSAAAWISGSNARAVAMVQASKASLVIAEYNFPIDKIDFQSKTLILCKNPRLEFARLVTAFKSKSQTWKIHPSALIHPDAEIPDQISIGPHCIIGRAKIGKNTIIQGQCYIHDDVIIGDRVELHAHTCIGSDGFSFERNEIGRLEKFPHIGTCIIEDEVEIYPFANIDRGTLGEVRIGRGSKIDHHAHIGHNCTVGQDSIITAGVVMCGGSSVGDQTWIGVHSTIKDKITVGSRSFIGLNSLVTKDVPEGECWIGSPARFLRKYSESN